MNPRIFLGYIPTYTSPQSHQIQSYVRGLLVRAVDPLTHGALRARLDIVGSTVHLRSFLDPPTPAGHTIKGSGLVAYRSNRKNSAWVDQPFSLHRACGRHLQSLGVQACDYNYGRAKVLDVTASVSLNGRRSVEHAHHTYPSIFRIILTSILQKS